MFVGGDVDEVVELVVFVVDVVVDEVEDVVGVGDGFVVCELVVLFVDVLGGEGEVGGGDVGGGVVVGVIDGSVVVCEVGERIGVFVEIVEGVELEVVEKYVVGGRDGFDGW